MRRKFRKILALALSICTLLTLAVPTVSAADYSFPDIGEVTELGVVLKSNPNISGQAEIVEKDGRQYLGVPIKGGKFCVFALTDFLEKKPNAHGNYLYDIVDSGISVPRGVALDSKGNFYVTGDSSSVFYYNIHTGKSGKISTGASGTYAVAVDEQDNVYVAAKSGGAAVYQVNINTLTARKIYTSADFTYANGVTAGGGKVYFQGPLTTGAGGGAQVRMLSAGGKLLDSYDMPGSGGSYYLSYVDGVVFCGTSAKSTDGLVALDTAGNKLTKIDIGMNSPMLGVATKERNGKSYIVVSGQGIYEYDVATRQLGRKVSSAGNRAMRAVNGYVKNGEDVLLLSVGPSSVTTTKGISGNAVSLSGLLEGAYTTYTARTMAAGVPGTGVAVYVGAYLNAGVSSYSPDAKTPINFKAFSNGHDQTDSMIVYNGKLYGGAYSGGYLFEYDPKTGMFRELIKGLKADYEQIRIHGLAAGDNKIFFSTIPNDQTLGGCIGWYDLTTDSWYCERNVVQDQAVITLAYDEDKDILYGGSTIRGGTNTTPKAQQAVVFAYDVNAKKVLASAKASSLTGDKPRYISGIARDPNTGKFWGLVAQTVFSFAYENGSLKLTKEWSAGTNPSDPYPDGASKSWFPRPILFDAHGGMYIGLNEQKYGIMKFTLGADGKIKKTATAVASTTRIYCMGADGNLYYYDSQLHMVTISRATMVRQMIDTTSKTDSQAVAQVRLAYDSLTQEEKELVGSGYYSKLLALEGNDAASDQVAVDAVIDAINAIGTVTAASGPAIETARDAYDNLTPAQQAKVTNAQLLLDAEKTFGNLASQDRTPVGEEEDTDPDAQPDTQPDAEPDVAVISVQAQIDALGTVTADSGPMIRAARAAYDALTPEQQAKVNNARFLFAAEEAFKILAPPEQSPMEEIDAALISVWTQINAIGVVTADSGPMIRGARAAYDALTPEQQAKVNNAQLLFAAEETFQALADPAQPSESNGDATWIIVIVAVLVLAAGAVLAVIIVKHKRR